MSERVDAGRGWIAAGAVSAFVAVAAGAFGAHALRARLDPALLAVFETGARYQMFHALALLAVGLDAGRARGVTGRGGRLHAVAGTLFVAGTILFSGSLYALALSGVRALGAVTPLGGLAFLAGWIAFAAAALRRGGSPSP